MSKTDLIARWEAIRLGGGKTLRSAGDDLVAALRAAEARLSERSMEADVGRWVYSRIDALMDAKPGTAEAVELSYLASAVGSVEEYGVENCEGHDLGGDALRAAEAENARLSEENRTFRTNYRSGTSGDLNASDMRNIPDQEDDVSEAQEWEDFDRDC